MGVNGISPNSSARPIVHRKTPPNATSSPNITAVSSSANAALQFTGRSHGECQAIDVDRSGSSYLWASRIDWYIFILRVSTDEEMSGSSHLMPGVFSADSRVVRSSVEVAIPGRSPSAGGADMFRTCVRAGLCLASRRTAPFVDALETENITRKE